MWLHQKTNSKTFYIGEQVTTALSRDINDTDCLEKHPQRDAFFCRYPIILLCRHSMSATGRTGSASVAASLPNPNSMVRTHTVSTSRSLAVSDNFWPPTVVSPLGNSLSAILDGEARLTFLNRGEDYVMNMPYAHCKGRCPTLGHVWGCSPATLTSRCCSAFLSQASCMAP